MQTLNPTIYVTSSTSNLMASLAHLTIFHAYVHIYLALKFPTALSNKLPWPSRLLDHPSWKRLLTLNLASSANISLQTQFCSQLKTYLFTNLTNLLIPCVRLTRVSLLSGCDDVWPASDWHMFHYCQAVTMSDLLQTDTCFTTVRLWRCLTCFRLTHVSLL